MANVVITGAHGYLGRHVLRSLCQRGYHVLAIDRSRCSSLYGEECLMHDVLANPLGTYAAWGYPDAILHLAWQDGFNHNAASHIELWPKHYAFCKSIIDEGCPSLTVLGSMHEVGYYEGCMSENVPCNPLNNYAIAKNKLRTALEDYTLSHAVSFKWLRCFYLIGDDMRNQSIFTKILKAAFNKAESFPLTDGTAQYDFSDIDAAANAIVCAAMQKKIEGVINICSGSPRSLKDVVNCFLEENALDIRLEFGKFPRRPYDSPLVYGDTKRLRLILENR